MCFASFEDAIPLASKLSNPNWEGIHDFANPQGYELTAIQHNSGNTAENFT